MVQQDVAACAARRTGSPTCARCVCARELCVLQIPTRRTRREESISRDSSPALRSGPASVRAEVGAQPFHISGVATTRSPCARPSPAAL